VIDLPAAQLYVRTHIAHAETDQGDRGRERVNPHRLVSPVIEENWKNLVLIFPNDLGPFPISYYAEKNGLTTEEVWRINHWEVNATESIRPLTFKASTQRRVI